MLDIIMMNYSLWGSLNRRNLAETTVSLRGGEAGGLCVLVDREGKPIVSPLPIDD